MVEIFFGQSRGLLIPWLELLVFILIIIAFFQNMAFVRKFGKSAMGLFFIYILAGTSTMATIVAIILLFNLEILSISESTLMVWWHFIFYTGMTALLLGLHTMEKSMSSETERTAGKYTLIISIFVGFSLLIFTFAYFLNGWITSIIEGSLVDRMGIFHFIAFAFAILMAIKLFRIRSKFGSIIKNFIPALFIFLISLSLIHLWELLAESWKVFTFEDSIIENVEQVFWLAAFAALNYGFFNIRKSLKKALNLQENKIQ